MASAAPLAVVVPALTACVLAAGGKHVSRGMGDGIALAAAAATTALCALLLAHVWHGTEVYWFGGWHVRKGDLAVGISFTVDTFGAGAATFVGLLVTASLVYSTRYFEAVAPLYHALVLIFLTGMVGFCLTGDLFNMFVFFELMSVPAYALTGYKAEERGPLQGALNFAISNSVGSYLMLAGIGLIYGRTGALNMAQAGSVLGSHPTDTITIVAFTLIVCGLLVKAAAFPFHFWLSDAHAVAPVPICVLFSGIMVELALYGIARVYWTTFAGQPGMHAEALTTVLVVVGVVTALVGGVMAVIQRHVKRLLAFSTVSHVGMFLTGLALLDPHGLSAAALFVLAHGLVKGSLFMLIGVIGHRAGTVDEGDLQGRGRGLWVTGAAFALGGLALASVPPFGPFEGKALVEEAATDAGKALVPWLFVVAGALAGGAILRVAARTFLGIGDPLPAPDRSEEGQVEEEAAETEPETVRGEGRTPLVMIGPAVVLMVAGLALPVIPHLTDALDHAATRLEAHDAYLARVLHSQAVAPPPTVPTTGPHTAAYLFAVASVLGALAIAACGLYAPRVAERLGRLATAGSRATRLLHAWHSGHLGDYVTWLVVGVVVVGWTLRISLP